MPSSRPTDRVVRVLELLGAHPGGLRFSDLARAGSLSQGTCHAILGTLSAAGYVVRDPETLTYTLGPAVVALGHAASEAFGDVRGHHDELERLAHGTGLAASAAKVVDDAITVVDVAAPEGVGPPVRVGTRVPFAPPFGAIHVAWSGPRAIEAWIARAPRDTLTPTRLLAVLDDHRRTRLAVAPYTATSSDLRAALADLAIDALARDVRERTLALLSEIDELDYTSDAIADAEHLAVNTITAPVFDRDARTAFAVALHVGDPELPVARLEVFAEALRTATTTMTTAIGGREPDDDRSAVLTGGTS